MSAECNKIRKENKYCTKQYYYKYNIYIPNKHIAEA